MNQQILDKLISSFLDDLILQSKNLFSDLIDEGKQFIKKNLSTYLIKQKKRFSFLKTLLHGNTPIQLYDIYFPLKIRNDNKISSTDSIKRYIQNS